MQRPARNDGTTVGGGDFYVVRSEAISCDRSSPVQLMVGGDEKRSLKSETVKYGRESQGTRTRESLR
jgi:hypothetical protein